MADEAIETGLIGGIEKREITILDYDPTWPQKFEMHAARIAAAVGPSALRIEHIGSTSVPDLAAKPIIDILVVVQDSADESAYLPQLERAGYVLRVREPSWHEHRMVRTPERDVHIHIYSTGCPEIERNLSFRDRLRRNVEDRRRYDQTKRESAAREWSDMNAYAEAKTEVIESIITSAQGQSDISQLPEVLSRVDHLVYATPDLELGIAQIQQLTGMQAIHGGRHPRWGTWNALISLGPATYLEIIAPDATQFATAHGPRPFGLDVLEGPKLVTWAVKATDPVEVRRRAATHGIQLGEVVSGSRRAPDGTHPAWRLTDPQVSVADGIVPFFIDWLNSPHPAENGPEEGAHLIELRALHPNARAAADKLAVLGIDLRVDSASTPGLIAVLDTPRGRVELH